MIFARWQVQKRAPQLCGSCALKSKCPIQEFPEELALDADPALIANPDLPVTFVFNEKALAKLQLSSKRIYFYLETLQDLTSRRELNVYLGNPNEFAQKNAVAVTYAPVPSFAKFTNLAQVHPFLWLKSPHPKSIRSFSAWRDKLK